MSQEEDDQLECDIGVTAAQAREDEALDAQAVILEAIRETPARTLAGLRVKAAIFMQDGAYGTDKDTAMSLARDVLAMAPS